jgi:hypothetical protein
MKTVQAATRHYATRREWIYNGSMKGGRSKATAIVLGIAIFAGGGAFLEKRQQLRQLQAQNAELKREVESMRERLDLLQVQPILCAGTFSSGCGNGPRPASPWESPRR